MSPLQGMAIQGPTQVSSAGLTASSCHCLLVISCRLQSSKSHVSTQQPEKSSFRPSEQTEQPQQRVQKGYGGEKRAGK